MIVLYILDYFYRNKQNSYAALIRSSANIAVHICQLKRRSAGFFSWNALTNISLLAALVIKGLVIYGNQNVTKTSLVVCDGYVKYEKTEIDRWAIVQDLRNDEKNK